MDVAFLGFYHDREIAYVNVIRLLLDAVLDHGNGQLDGGHVGKIPEAGLHGRKRFGSTVGLLDPGGAYVNGGLGMGVDLSVLVPLPAYPDRDDIAISSVLIQQYYSPLTLVLRNPDVVHNLLHPAVRVVYGRQEIVVGRDMMVHYAPVLKKGLNKFSHRFTYPLITTL